MICETFFSRDGLVLEVELAVHAAVVLVVRHRRRQRELGQDVHARLHRGPPVFQLAPAAFFAVGHLGGRGAERGDAVAVDAVGAVADDLVDRGQDLEHAW